MAFMYKLDEIEQMKLLAPGGRVIKVRGVASAALRHSICTTFIPAIFLILVMIVLLLVSSVCKIKGPIVKMTSIRIGSLDVLNNMRANANRHVIKMTLEGDLSIENSNMASFKFNSATTDLSYEEEFVGRSVTQKGEALPGKALLMSVPEIDVKVHKIERMPRYPNDVMLAIVPFATDTRLDGEVKITSSVKKSFVADIHCDFKVNLKESIVQFRRCSTSISA